MGLAFSPECQLLASASFDDTVRLWNVENEAACGILRGHLGFISAIVFSPDSQLLASASDYSTIRLWNARTGAACGTLAQRAVALAFSPNCQLLASADRRGLVRLWNVMTGAACVDLQYGQRMVRAIAFSPNGQLLASGASAPFVERGNRASGAADARVRLWHCASGALLTELVVAGRIRRLSFSDDGSFLKTNIGLIPNHLSAGRSAGAQGSSVFGYTIDNSGLLTTKQIFSGCRSSVDLGL